MSITKQKITIIAVSFFILLAPLISSAAASTSTKSGLVPCGGYNADGSLQSPCTVTDIFSLVSICVNWLIDVAGIYAVFQIVNAGFWLTISMGSEESIAKWRKALTEAVVGFVLVMMAYLLVNTAVNYILLDGNQCSYKVDLTNPLSYLTTSSYTTNPGSCPPN